MYRDHSHKKWAFLKVFFGIAFVAVISTVLMSMELADAAIIRY